MIRNIVPTPVALAMGTALAAGGGAAHAETEFYVGVFSDYINDGASDSDNNAVVQGGVEYGHASGLYLGTAMSTLADDEGQELDLYLGQVVYLGAHALDLGYTYSHYSELDDADEGELHVAVERGPLTAEVAYMVNADDSDAEGDTTVALDYVHNLDRHNRIDLGIGHAMPDDSDADDVTFWSLGVARTAGDGEISLTYASTDESGSQDLFVAGYSISF